MSVIVDVPSLVVTGPGGTVTLPPERVHLIGRDPDADVTVDAPMVSWQHAQLLVAAGQWLIQDAGSTNGTFCDGQPVRRMRLTGTVRLRLGHPAEGPLLTCSVPGAATAAPAGRATAAHPATALWPSHAAGGRPPTGTTPVLDRVLRIGRAGDNDVVVEDLRVSRHHAELRSLGGGRFELTDAGSQNGTHVNGERIAAAVVTEADVIDIGAATFLLAGGELREYHAADGVLLGARGLTVTLPGGQVLLDDVSFPLPERCLLGVIGPSGAGKSTLLGALTGTRPATSGSVLYDGRDLYDNYAELRHRIGLVPQENILHTQLSARRGLSYAAELRFPQDTSAAERTRRVEEVLGELSLGGHADIGTGSLSGGQRKRVNVALELLTKPSLLFLDEPTSGLDPGLDRSVMEMLAGLAADGRTVVVVTHSVASLASCDRILVLVPGGRVAYFGTPDDGLRHFGRADWAAVFQDFAAQPDRDWAADYRRSADYARYTGGPLQALGAAARPEASRAAAGPSTTGPSKANTARSVAPTAPRPASLLAQLVTLVRRYVSVIAADRNYVAVIALLPVILGGLVRAIPDAGGLTGPDNGLAIQLLLILVMSACLTGVASSVRELVKERAIYARERAAGLSPAAYLGSKLVVLGIISAVQSVVLVAIGLAGRPMPPRGVLTPVPLAEIMLGVAVLAIASMTAGLLISAAVSSSDKTLPLLVVTVLVEVVLSGGVIRLNGSAGLEQLAWFTPSRWGFAAVASTVDLNHVTPPPPGASPDPLWRHSARLWAATMALQLVLAGVFTVLTWLLLRRPARRLPGDHLRRCWHTCRMTRRAARGDGGAEPPVMLRSQHAEATRRAVLDAAKSLFGRQGYAQTSVDEIADAARVTKGAVYHHFAGKEALFRAVYAEVETDAQARVLRAGTAGMAPAEQLVAMMNAYLDAALDVEIRRITLVDGPAIVGQEIDNGAEQQPGYTALRAFLATAIASGELKDLDPGALTGLLGGMAWVAGLLIARAGDPDETRAALGRALDAMLRGLAAESDSAPGTAPAPGTTPTPRDTPAPGTTPAPRDTE